ncbi:DUF4145 domain-containing protein [Pseudoalteromonas sp. SG44-1]|uniref:DUF4145 domain-containing protein n=1 Tax=Pseudoalteromonas sp. SG44-1 TaxID=2760964 RepID=UPI001C725B37|nr:DUF4145 domain-containing protein [Pseudoalteromonas sp. SG44-1]
MEDKEGYWFTNYGTCSSCENIIIDLIVSDKISRQMKTMPSGVQEVFRVYPQTTSFDEPNEIVPECLRKDFIEASLIMTLSPKASAALSRRCLQSILRDKAGVKKGSLDREIQQAMEHLPSHIAGAIDAVRQIGNFAAHPMKSDSTGEIVEVEAGEAQWNLDVLESLFDFYYVQPSLLAEKQNALNKKLADIGKPPMKTSI